MIKHVVCYKLKDNSLEKKQEVKNKERKKKWKKMKSGRNDIIEIIQSITSFE